MNRFWFWVLHHVPDFANFDKFSDEITYCPICGRSRDSARPKPIFILGAKHLAHTNVGRAGPAHSLVSTPVGEIKLNGCGQRKLVRLLYTGPLLCQTTHLNSASPHHLMCPPFQYIRPFIPTNGDLGNPLAFCPQ